MKIAIIGNGYVGAAMEKLFPDAVIYDEPKGIGSKKDVNACDIAFVCVPTPEGESGECDTHIVEEVIDWLETEVIVIRSTVPVGFTDSMIKKYKKSIVFQPEYCGETVGHPYVDLSQRKWITLGGSDPAAEKVVNAYHQVCSSDVIINIVDSKTAELAKYMENCFLATKVIFCNEFYDLAEKMGVSYTKLRETWLMDERMGRSHTFVYPDARGYAGKCLPKDVDALLVQAENQGVDMNVLRSVKSKNSEYNSGKKEY